MNEFSNNTINFMSEDENVSIDLVITSIGTIFKINKMDSTPTILLLTLKRLITKLEELNIESVNNLILSSEVNMFNKKTIKQKIKEKVLIEIKTDDLFSEFVNVFGIDKLVLT